MGILIMGKRQTWSRYLVVVLITVGIFLFSLGKTVASDRENSTYGIALLCLSLAMDGVTGPVQERIIHAYKPSQYHMMYFCNWWSCVLLGAGFFLCNE